MLLVRFSLVCFCVAYGPLRIFLEKGQIRVIGIARYWRWGGKAQDVFFGCEGACYE